MLKSSRIDDRKKCLYKVSNIFKICVERDNGGLVYFVICLSLCWTVK